MKPTSILIPIYFVFLLAYQPSSAQWVKLNTDSLHAYCAIHFLNNDTGFIAGSYSQFGPDGVVLRTINGGDTWDTTIVVFAGFLMDIQFINDSTGFAGGQDGNIIWTQDMGDSWSYYGSCQASSDITNFYFLEPDSALILDVFGDLHLFNSQNCPSLLNTSAYTTFPGTGALDFISSNEAYMSGGNGLFLKSFDSGANWSYYNCDSTLEVLGATMYDTNNSVVVGKNGQISISGDGGSSWSQPISISSYDLMDVEFSSLNTMYCIGGLYKLNVPGAIGNGSIWKTTDGGANWAVDDTSYSDLLNDIDIVNDSLAFAVGYSGLLLRKQIPLGPTSIANEDYSLSINAFPNPFTNSITVLSNRQLNYSTNVLIVDQIGRTVYSENFEGRSKNIDTSRWGVGIYHLTLSSNQISYSRKLFKAK